MKEYKVTFKVKHSRGFLKSYYAIEKEIVNAHTFKEARELIRNKYNNNVSNIIIEEQTKALKEENND